MEYFAFLRENRRFLAFGYALSLGSSFGQTFFIAIFGAEIRAAFDLTHGGFGAAYLVATLLSGASMMLVGHRIDTIDLRLFSALVCGGLAAGCFVLAAAPSLAALYLALFALRLFGQGLMSHTSMTSMARYFDAGRGKAMSIASLGMSTGEALFPLAGVALVAALGWRGSWTAMGVAVIVLLLPLTLWLLKEHGERHEQMIERSARAENSAGAAVRQWTRNEVLRDPRFYLIMPAVMVPAFVLTGLIFHQVYLAEVKGWSLAWLATCFMGFAAAKVAASLIAGPLIDRLGALRILPWVMPPLVLGLFVVAAFAHPGAAFVYMTLAGMTTGAGMAVVGAMWAEIYGVRHVGAIRALISALMVVGTGLAPAGMGWLIDGGMPITTIAYGCAAMTLASTILAAAVARRWTRQKV
jgi:MFS family permease